MNYQNLNPNNAERILREALAAKYGEGYISLMLRDWRIDGCNADCVTVRAGSPFQGDVIRHRLLPDMAQILAAVSGICPGITVVLE